MRSSALPTWLIAIAAATAPILAQTSTKCQPLTQSCPPDPALAKTVTIDYTKGESSQFSGGATSYESNGANFVVAKSGDSPTIISNWFMMFGHVEVVMQASTGVGIVSSMVLQSDDLDEIDLEWLGAYPNEVQSNYFGKGETLTYDRGETHNNPGDQTGFHTYTVDWTSEQVVWQIDGQTVRTLTPATADANQYPQTPMQLKLGSWSAGDPSNAPGTITWAGGPTNYGAGPFTMIVQSIVAQDYSTGTQYSYSDNSGTWQSIKSNGGTIYSGTNPVVASAASAAPAPTATTAGGPPFDSTDTITSSTTTHTGFPWVASSSTLITSTTTGSFVFATGTVASSSTASATPASSFSSAGLSAPGSSSNGTKPSPTSLTGPATTPFSGAASTTRQAISFVGPLCAIFAATVLLL